MGEFDVAIGVSGDNELLSTYYCALGSLQHRCMEGILKESPRWAEPVLTFVARCIDQVELNESVRKTPALQSLELSVIDFRRGKRPVAHLKVRAAANDGLVSPWRLARDACLMNSQGHLDLPAMPEPLSPPVRTHAGMSYCRIADLPDDARHAASWVMRPALRLSVKGHKDAVPPELIRNFLSNNADIPRPFGSWVWP